MKLFMTCIVVGLLLIGTGVAMAIPASASLSQIVVGAALCWLALPVFWLASQVQPR